MARTYLENECAFYEGRTPAEFTAENLDKIKEMLKMKGVTNPDAVVPADECFTCSICGEYIENEWSHNAQPVNDGRCCIKCNYKVVLPARLKEMGVK